MVRPDGQRILRQWRLLYCHPAHIASVNIRFSLTDVITWTLASHRSLFVHPRRLWPAAVQTSTHVVTMQCHLRHSVQQQRVGRDLISVHRCGVSLQGESGENVGRRRGECRETTGRRWAGTVYAIGLHSIGSVRPCVARAVLNASYRLCTIHRTTRGRLRGLNSGRRRA